MKTIIPIRSYDKIWRTHVPAGLKDPLRTARESNLIADVSGETASQLAPAYAHLKEDMPLIRIAQEEGAHAEK